MLVDDAGDGSEDDEKDEVYVHEITVELLDLLLLVEEEVYGLTAGVEFVELLHEEFFLSVFVDELIAVESVDDLDEFVVLFRVGVVFRGFVVQVLSVVDEAVDDVVEEE